MESARSAGIKTNKHGLRTSAGDFAQKEFLLSYFAHKSGMDP